MQSSANDPSANADGTDFVAARRSEVNVERAYTFAELSRYSLKDRWLIRAADLAFYFLINLIGRTIRFEVEGWQNYEAIIKNNKLPIYVFWHETIFLTTYWWRWCRGVVLTSKSFDGEYIARFIQRFGYGAVRGSSTRGGIGAVVEMARLMRAGCSTCFVVDGPRGPRRVVKMGALLLAKRTGHPVLPLTVATDKYWTLPSWDSFQIPRPFTRAKVFISPAIYLGATATDDDLETRRKELQAELENLDRRAEDWRQSL